MVYDNCVPYCSESNVHFCRNRGDDFVLLLLGTKFPCSSSVIPLSAAMPIYLFIRFPKFRPQPPFAAASGKVTRSRPAMTTVPDAELREYAENARGKVAIITGGAMGLGKQAGGEFIRAGCVRRFPFTNSFPRECQHNSDTDLFTSAKVVIGDLNLPAAEATVAEWTSAGG
jgi:hypothetical protein